MPSFLTKVFGRKKDDKLASSPPSHASKRHSNASLLEGKYEAVSPNVSPSAARFTEAAQQPRDKDSNPLSLFRSRSRNPSDQPRPNTAGSTTAPLLTLNLPVPKEEKSRALGVVFEADPDNISSLSDPAIGERRLNPLEALLLVKACAEAIEHTGLETLGLMHPHWYSASPEVQRKLISLYILSLASKTQSPITTLTPTPTSPAALFTTELEYTRSPHDIAAVLRWAIRHLRLEGSSFGSASASEWGWYIDFAKKERDGGYAPKAFSQSLLPSLPPAHHQLLAATLEIISSLAAHAETTGTSGSKLAKMFGLWLLAVPRIQSGEAWVDFYARWERAGRILEHLFLAYVREESLTNKMPIRLSELVKHYPYASQNATLAADPIDDLPLLPRPRFSTRRYDALFVRIDTQLPSSNAKRPTRDHPLRLISEAVRAAVASDASIAEEANTIWQDIKKRTSEEGEVGDNYPILTRILDDETLRILSFVPADPSDNLGSPTSTASTSTPIVRQPTPRRRSSSLGPNPGNGRASANGANGGHTRDGTAPAAFTNWSDFSVVGFGESLLTQDFAATLERDVEVTAPPPSSWTTGKKRPGRSRSSSVDNAPPARPTEQRGRGGAPEEPARKALLTRVDIVQVDEAFFDFWSDALLDPVASSWPAFIVCQLKPGAWKLNLLVIEHSYSAPPPPPLPPVPPLPQFANEKRAASPRPSLSSNMSARKSFTFSPTKKRFSFFSTHSAADVSSKSGRKGSRTPARSPRIGELGEILPEEPVVQPPPVPALPKPTEVKTQASLPAVPLVSAEPIAPADISIPISVEPVKIDEDVLDRPLLNLPEGATVPADNADKTLPPTPEPVVAAGSTPSAYVALSSSEPAGFVEASQAAVEEHPTIEKHSTVEHTEAHPTSLPSVSALAELVTSAPVDPPPEHPDADVGTPVAVALAGSDARPQTPTEPEIPEHNAAVAEPIAQPAPIHEDAHTAANPVETVQDSTDSPREQVSEPDPEQNAPVSAGTPEHTPEPEAAAAAPSAPSPSSSEETKVGSEGEGAASQPAVSHSISEIRDAEDLHHQTGAEASSEPQAHAVPNEETIASQDPAPAHTGADGEEQREASPAAVSNEIDSAQESEPRTVA